MGTSSVIRSCSQIVASSAEGDPCGNIKSAGQASMKKTKLVQMATGSAADVLSVYWARARRLNAGRSLAAAVIGVSAAMSWLM